MLFYYCLLPAVAVGWLGGGWLGRQRGLSYCSFKPFMGRIGSVRLFAPMFGGCDVM